MAYHLPSLNPPDPLMRMLRDEVETTKVSRNAQARALEDLFKLFTQQRSTIARNDYLSVPRYRNAYLRYHFPLNFARAAYALQKVAEVYPRITELDQLIDLGAGPGSAALATLFSLPSKKRNYVLYDRSRAALGVARRLVDGCRADAGVKRDLGSFQTRRLQLPTIPTSSEGTLLWIAMVYNELGSNRRDGPKAEAFAERLTRSTRPGSVVLRVEPALRGPTIELMRLHDALIARPGWRVLAPCTHEAPCPLLEIRSKPWCHFHFRWRPPEFTRHAAESLGLKSPQASLAFLALERTGAQSLSDDAKAKRSPRRARVISDKMTSSTGKPMFYICAEGARNQLKSPPQPCWRGDLLEQAQGGTYRRLAQDGNRPRERRKPTTKGQNQGDQSQGDAS